jgi:hypothetical protein
VLLGVPLGVLIDRVRSRRTVLVAMALLGAAAIASVPAAGGMGGPHLVTMVLATGVLGMLAQIGQDAFLPSVVGRERLVPANTLLAVLTVLVFFALGPVLASADPTPAGLLVFAALLLAGTAAAFRWVSAPEEPPPPRTGFWREAAEGLRFTVREPDVRAIALYFAAAELSAVFAGEVARAARSAMVTPSATPLGGLPYLLTTASNYGALALAVLLIALLHRRLGAFRLAWVAALASQPFLLLLAFSGQGAGLVWIGLGTLVPPAGTIIVAIALLSHRQAITPDRLLGRVGGLLFVLTALAEMAGTLMQGPAEWLADLGGSLLPGAGVSTALALACAVPLLLPRRRTACGSRASWL